MLTECRDNSALNVLSGGVQYRLSTLLWFIAACAALAGWGRFVFSHTTVPARSIVGYFLAATVVGSFLMSLFSLAISFHRRSTISMCLMCITLPPIAAGIVCASAFAFGAPRTVYLPITAAISIACMIFVGNYLRRCSVRNAAKPAQSLAPKLLAVAIAAAVVGCAIWCLFIGPL